jgi:hypothetical protein
MPKPPKYFLKKNYLNISENNIIIIKAAKVLQYL